jgi:hypothetical protein
MNARLSSGAALALDPRASRPTRLASARGNERPSRSILAPHGLRAPLRSAEGASTRPGKRADRPSPSRLTAYGHRCAAPKARVRARGNERTGLRPRSSRLTAYERRQRPGKRAALALALDPRASRPTSGVAQRRRREYAPGETSGPRPRSSILAPPASGDQTERPSPSIRPAIRRSPAACDRPPASCS